MDLIKTVVDNYDILFKDKYAEAIIKELNKNQQRFISDLRAGIGENTIAKSIYGTSPSGQSYQSMKKSVQNIFENIIVANLSGCRLQKNKKKIYKQYAVIKNLELLGFRSTHVKMARGLLRKCNKLQVFDVAIEVSRLLAFHYYTYEKNHRLGEEYEKLCREFMYLHQLEIECEFKFSQIYHMTSREPGINSSNATFAGKMAKDMEVDLKTGCFKIYFFYYLIKYTEYYAWGNISKMLEVCKKALDYFENLHFDHSLAKSIFKIKILTIYLEQNEFAKAELLIDSVLEGTNVHEPNYIRFMELKLRLKMQKEDDTALQYFNEIGFLKLKYIAHDALRERFLIYQMYLNIMNDRFEEVNIRKIKYNLNKLAHGTQTMKIPLLIGELVFYILTGKEDKIIDKTESLRIFNRKHLPKGANERTSVFLDLLITASNNQEYGSILEQLKSLKQSIHESELEIIPYELLWDKIIQNTMWRVRRW